MTWETVIGLETHAELATRTKIFCSCTTRFGGEPNTHCCPICTGMPGTLPMVNRKVVEYACRAGLALNCEITRRSRFDRKNYFYPDLPKAYQVSQLYLPIARNGRVSIATAAGEKVVRIHELHMEEDAGKLMHDPWLDQTMVDYNRCGVPLLEIVSEPDFRSADEVVDYLEKLREMLVYMDVSDCKMQEGSLRCDVNISVRPVGSNTLGTRAEIKNMNSFTFIEKAVAYEMDRQIDLIESGEAGLQPLLREQLRRVDTHLRRCELVVERITRRVGYGDRQGKILVGIRLQIGDVDREEKSRIAFPVGAAHRGRQRVCPARQQHSPVQGSAAHGDADRIGLQLGQPGAVDAQENVHLPRLRVDAVILVGLLRRPAVGHGIRDVTGLRHIDHRTAPGPLAVGLLA